MRVGQAHATNGMNSVLRKPPMRVAQVANLPPQILSGSTGTLANRRGSIGSVGRHREQTSGLPMPHGKEKGK